MAKCIYDDKRTGLQYIFFISFIYRHRSTVTILPYCQQGLPTQIVLYINYLFVSPIQHTLNGIYKKHVARVH